MRGCPVSSLSARQRAVGAGGMGGHPEPRVRASAPHKGASACRVRALGRRPRAFPPTARHPPDAAGTSDTVDPGPSSSQQRRCTHGQRHRSRTGRFARQGPPRHHPPLSGHRCAMPCRATDNGGEFAAHEVVTEKTGIRAFFCDPHGPWQRGGIENANGLIRRDLPRKTSLSDYNDDDIWNLNSTPRKCLGYRTPIEAFAAQLGVALEM